MPKGTKSSHGNISLPAKRSRAGLNFIFITVFLDVLAFGLALPVLPRLVEKFVGGSVAQAALIIGFFGTAWALMQFIFSPLAGLLSDRFGRRPVILLSNFGLAADYIIMALAPSLSWLLAGRLLSGIMSASITAANAYISDVTPPKERAGAFGILGAAFGLGFIIGPALGGFLAVHDPRLPFWLAAGFSSLNFLYGLLILPESLPRSLRHKSLQWKKANPLGALKLLRRHPELSGLSLVNFLGNLAHEVYIVVFILYVGTRYEWGSDVVGGLLALVGVSSAVVSAWLVNVCIKRVGEYKTLITGMVFGMLGFALFGGADAGWIFIAAIPLNALWGLAGPPLQSLATARVEASEQGELQGAMACVRGVAMLIGPGMFATVYATGLRHDPPVPGAPWYLAAGLVCAAGLISAWIARKRRS